jgi:hypothetical protein
LVRFMAVDNYKTWAYCAYYPRMVHLGSIWDIQANDESFHSAVSTKPADSRS